MRFQPSTGSFLASALAVGLGSQVRRSTAGYLGKCWGRADVVDECGEQRLIWNDPSSSVDGGRFSLIHPPSVLPRGAAKDGRGRALRRRVTLIFAGCPSMRLGRAGMTVLRRERSPSKVASPRILIPVSHSVGRVCSVRACVHPSFATPCGSLVLSSSQSLSAGHRSAHRAEARKSDTLRGVARAGAPQSWKRRLIRRPRPRFSSLVHARAAPPRESR